MSLVSFTFPPAGFPNLLILYVGAIYLRKKTIPIFDFFFNIIRMTISLSLDPDNIKRAVGEYMESGKCCGFTEGYLRRACTALGHPVSPGKMSKAQDKDLHGLLGIPPDRCGHGKKTKKAKDAGERRVSNPIDDLPLFHRGDL